MNRTAYLIVFALFVACSAQAEWVDTDPEDGRVPVESPLFGAIEFQYMPVRYPKYVWTDDVRTTKDGNGVRVALEWIVTPPHYGKLGLGLGASYQRIDRASLGDDRYANLTILPIESYVSYRFDYVVDQVLVPFVRGGARVSMIQQSSNTGGGRDGSRGIFAWDYGGGLQLCLDNLDPQSAKYFDKSSGVNATFLTVEYLRSVPTAQARAVAALDHEEIRAGLRFEF